MPLPALRISTEKKFPEAVIGEFEKEDNSEGYGSSFLDNMGSRKNSVYNSIY